MMLREIANKHKCAPLKVEHYMNHYGARLSPYLGKSVLLEIGVQFGASVKTWREWFPQSMKIVGIDVDVDCLRYADEANGLYVEIANATHEQDVESVLSKHGNPDIIIDDGGHGQRDQRKSFDLLWPKLKPGGMYVIEDLCCAYIPFYMQDEPKGNICRHIFNLSERMHNQDRGVGRKEISAVYWYPTMVFIEKGDG